MKPCSATRLALSILILATLAGCAAPVRFPPPLTDEPAEVGRKLAYDVDHDGQADYWQFTDAAGRKTALAWLDPLTGKPGERLELDRLDPRACPHYLIVLDGVPFELVAEMYQQGHFRLFYPPARLICCYPAMTDLALSQLFHSPAPPGLEAVYFDRTRNRLVGGTADYLAGKAAPWLAQVDYRCSMLLDGQCYLNPKSLFEHELRGFVRTFERAGGDDAVVYSVGTAGLGTRGGAAAIREYLTTIERLCEQIVYQRHGRVKITITADHGHNLTPCKRVSFRRVLQAGGYRVGRALHGPRDVVPVSYGLVTYAAFYTDDPAGVSRCLLYHEAVEFCTYRDQEAVVVLGREGSGRIERRPGGFRYEVSGRDPLGLDEVLARLRAAGAVDSQGTIDEQALFAATVSHEYPDPLARLWEAFNGLVAHPADVIANLRDGACHGSRFFYTMIGGDVASTHGSLNRANSTTFALTMLGQLPPAMRSRELLEQLEKLRGAPVVRPPAALRR